MPVSSSLIRWLVAYGRVRDAAICLGRPYTLHGEETGRTLELAGWELEKITRARSWDRKGRSRPSRAPGGCKKRWAKWLRRKPAGTQLDLLR